MFILKNLRRFWGHCTRLSRILIANVITSTIPEKGENHVSRFRFIQNAFFSFFLFFDYPVKMEGRIWLQTRPRLLINDSEKKTKQKFKNLAQKKPLNVIASTQ